MSQLNVTTNKSEEDAMLAFAAETPQGVDALSFKEVSGFAMFKAEYTFSNNDIVFHFFIPTDNALITRDAVYYWMRKFPTVLDEVARGYWDVTYPRLKAAFTEEVNSWWLRAFGFVDVGNPEVRVIEFLAQLNAAISKAGV
jgi:hypothetical protein